MEPNFECDIDGIDYHVSSFGQKPVVMKRSLKNTVTFISGTVSSIYSQPASGSGDVVFRLVGERDPETKKFIPGSLKVVRHLSMAELAYLVQHAFEFGFPPDCPCLQALREAFPEFPLFKMEAELAACRQEITEKGKKIAAMRRKITALKKKSGKK